MGHIKELTQATTLTPTTLSPEKQHVFVEIMSTGASMTERMPAQGWEEQPEGELPQQFKPL